jgi:hypothetical protein
LSRIGGGGEIPEKEETERAHSYNVLPNGHHISFLRNFLAARVATAATDDDDDGDVADATVVVEVLLLLRRR